MEDRLAGAAYLAKGALAAAESLKQDRSGFLQDEIARARFFTENLTGLGLARVVMNGAGSLKAGCVSEFAC